MISPRMKNKTGRNFSGVTPNIHLAACENDIDFMEYCLKNGQTLNDREEATGMVPLHVAAAYQSHDFIDAAFENGTADPWVVDSANRLPFDISSDFGDRIAMRKFLDAMYRGPFAKKPPGDVVQFPDPES